MYENDCFGQDNDFVWLPGAAPCVLVLPGGFWVVPGGPWVLPGGCLVVTGHKMNVLESFGKGVICPPDSKRGVWWVSPSIIVRNWTPSGARLVRSVLG